MCGLVYDIESRGSAAEIAGKTGSKIIEGFGIFFLLNGIYSGLDGIACSDGVSITISERLWLLPLALIGTFGGIILMGLIG